jgi:hypothetical protein
MRDAFARAPRAVTLDASLITPTDVFFLCVTCFGCFAIQALSQRAFARRGPNWFTALSAGARVDIGIRCASAVWGTIAASATIPVIVPVIMRGTTVMDRVYTVMPRARALCCAACGYFVWDVCVSLKYYDGIYVTHAIASVITFGMPQLMPNGFLHYYGVVFILWECSLPFLTARTILIKSGRGSTMAFYIAQTLGFGLFIALRFFMGLPVMYTYLMDAYEMYSRGLATPKPVYAFYVAGGLMFQIFNCIWVFGMARTVLRGKKKRV